MAAIDEHKEKRRVAPLRLTVLVLTLGLLLFGILGVVALLAPPRPPSPAPGHREPPQAHQLSRDSLRPAPAAGR